MARFGGYFTGRKMPPQWKKKDGFTHPSSSEGVDLPPARLDCFLTVYSPSPSPPSSMQLDASSVPAYALGRKHHIGAVAAIETSLATTRILVVARFTVHAV